MDNDQIQDGALVLLHRGQRTYLIKAVKERRYNFNEGIIEASGLIGKRYGDEVATHLGVRFKLIKPTLLDVIYLGFSRRTQVIYPKDAAMIIVKCGVGPGSRVVEAGTGSGYLTALLAYFVRPSGMVYSYEMRKEFIDVARENLALAGLLNYVVIKHKDVKESIDERSVDAVILDMADPWLAVRNAYQALRSGGMLACFLPTINQVERVVAEAAREGFVMLETVELLLRDYKVKAGETRPNFRMIGHTGYIVFARKP